MTDAKPEVTLKQQIILIKQAFPPSVPAQECQAKLHFIVNISTEFVIHLSLSLPNLYYTQTDKKKKNTHKPRQQKQQHKNRRTEILEKALFRAGRQVFCPRLFGLRGLCGQHHDDVCTPAMAPG